MNLAMLALHSSPVEALGARDAGGMSVVLVELSAALARRGHRVDLFTCRGGAPPGVPVEVRPGVRLIRVGGVPDAVAKAELYTHLPAVAAELSELVETNRWRYDRVHSHYWLSAVAGQPLAARWGVPHWVTFHTLGAVKNRLACGEDEPPRRLTAERDLALRCDRVIAPSERERVLLVECCGTSADRVAVVPWGVDREPFCLGDRGAARAALGIPGDAELLLFVGRFSPVKGLDLLLRALAVVVSLRPGVRLLVAGGDGPQGADTRAGVVLAAELGVASRVAWLGSVPRRGMPRLYRAADLLAVPSRYESFGLAALEALACGTPVVATRVGALDEVVVPGENGGLVDEAAPAPLAAAIAAQLAARRAAPEEVRSTVEDWTWDRSAAMIEALAIPR
ncbi:MAG: glycosyltransferase [Deferrisomatales bacterium]|nr:glycosyltransferase [Deferrisomatales bacterium]